MKIVIVGCSGFIGTELKTFFQGSGDEVIGLKVREKSSVEMLSSKLDGTDVLINLAGLSVFGRWSKAYKDSLYNSRVRTTEKLIMAMQGCKNRPKRFISSSAVGIYPNDIVCDEDCSELANSFLAHICKDWEKEAFKAEGLGVATIVFRSGIVLAKKGGMLQKMWIPFFLGLGGRIGTGKQPLSWVHIDDLCRAYKKVIEDKNLKGVYNLCAPKSTSNLELTRTLGSIMHRVTPFPVHAWLLRLLFAEGAEFMLEGQKVYPKRLLEAGFEFNYNNIRDALKSFL